MTTLHKKIVISLVIAIIVATVFALVIFSISRVFTPSYFISMSVASVAWGLIAIFSYILQSHFANSVPAAKKSLALLSHDDELSAQLRYLLPYQRYEVIFVHTIESLLKTLKKEDIGACIIDCENHSQDLDSLINLCRHQKECAQRLPIIAVSQNNNKLTQLNFLSIGFDGHLNKPMTQEQVNSFSKRWFNDETEKNTKLTQKIVPTIPVKKSLHFTPTTSATSSNTTVKRAVDIQASLLQSRQDHELAKDMLTMLINMIGENKDELIALYNQQSWTELGELVHKIKGGCCYCGVPELLEAITVLDSALEKNEACHIDKSFCAVISAVDDLLEWNNTHDIELIFEP